MAWVHTASASEASQSQNPGRPLPFFLCAEGGEQSGAEAQGGEQHGRYPAPPHAKLLFWAMAATNRCETQGASPGALPKMALRREPLSTGARLGSSGPRIS